MTTLALDTGKAVRIATIASHSSLQILKGAKDEGLGTVLICKKERAKTYERYGHLADKTILVDEFSDILDQKVQDELISENSVIVPHGSFVEYVGAKQIESRLNVPMFGNKRMFDWESDRTLQKKWLSEAGVRMPREFTKDDADGLCIVKLPGAKGGKGYFVVKGKDELKGLYMEGMTIQEYVVGATVYPHYFYSPLTGETELMSVDKRYETNADGLSRTGGGSQVEPTYVVCGNMPIVLRESLLPRVFEMGDRVVEASRKLFSPGIVGPFCIETVCTDSLEFVVFEVSARIVAGTNLYIDGSPYTALKYGESMSTGRRIAREIKNAVSSGRIEMLVS